MPYWTLANLLAQNSQGVAKEGKTLAHHTSRLHASVWLKAPRRVLSLLDPSGWQQNELSAEQHQHLGAETGTQERY